MTESQKQQILVGMNCPCCGGSGVSKAFRSIIRSRFSETGAYRLNGTSPSIPTCLNNRLSSAGKSLRMLQRLSTLLGRQTPGVFV